MKIRTLSAALLAAAAVAFPGIGAQASSHREAPFITETPKVDGTDFYMFMSYESGRQDYVTIVANYLPLQDSYGGPNYFTLDPDALYEIHVDNNGDAQEDLTFQFRFNNELKDIQLPVGGKQVSIPLVQAGQITAGNTAALNVVQTYTIDVVRPKRRGADRRAVTDAGSGSKTFSKPVDNIGNKTLPDYAAYAATHIHNINVPGCAVPGKVFVGQRKDPFVVNLGETFDLINLNPLGPVNGEANTIDDKNVTSIIVELHKSCLTAGSEPVIGGWTTASMRQARILREHPSFDRPAIEGGPWAQVSRLGMPLVNEVVIGLKDKDRFNASEPKDDVQFLTYVTNPTLPALISILFKDAVNGGNDIAPNNFPRNDLVAAFLTGINIPGVVNLNQPANVKPAEMLRLNTSIAPKAKGAQSNLGALGGDLAGFPNGRRPGDDVVDIELRVAMGALCHAFSGVFGCTATNAPVGNAPITDGAFVSDADFGATFPYLNTPIPGSPN